MFAGEMRGALPSISIGTWALPDANWYAVYQTFIAIPFLSFSALRLWQLRWACIKINPDGGSHIKVVAGLVFLTEQLLNLIAACSLSFSVLDVEICSKAAAFAAALVFFVLSFVEHRRSATPSTLLTLYMFASLFGDVAELIISDALNKSTSILLFVQIFLKIILLVVECRSKEAILLPQFRLLTPEEASGVFGRAFFWWITPILLAGFHSLLTDAELPGTDADLSARSLRSRVLRAWDQRVRPERTLTLPYVLLHCFKRPFAAAVLPRLILIIFRYSQPVLINVAIRYLGNAPKQSNSTEYGRWLIVSALVIYVGLAIFTALYQHHLNRLKIMVRGALVGLIYERALHVRGSGYEDGSAVSLMSTDVDSLQDVGEMFHETWAQSLEVLIGTCLLASQIGWLCPIPLIIICFCSQVSRYVATHLRGKQKDWNAATQQRLSMTISMLASAKSIKMLGISEAIQAKVQNLRIHEIETSKKLRWIMVFYNASANALGMFSPAITLVLFAIISRNHDEGKFDAGTAFTTIAVLVMVTHPANMIMTIVPRAVASLGNFERIQQYLLESSRRDERLDITSSEEQLLIDDRLEGTKSSYAIIARNLSVQYPTSPHPVLQNIDFEVEIGSVYICSGRVGSGKTTLAQAILGEISPSSGSISISTRRIGLCGQTPWLPSASIKEAICDDPNLDSAWYKTVINACGLRPDLDNLPEGDETQIGSRGLRLSGGQRQRVALARAVYARCDVLILDDPSSALDGATEHHIVQALLGPEGLLRGNGVTVFLITNNSQLYTFADQIIILGDSKIELRGPADDILQSTNQTFRTILKEKMRVEEQPQDKSLPQQSIQTTLTDADALNLTRRTGDLAVYGYYLKSVGVLNCILLVFFSASTSFFLTFSQYWLKWWTEDESDKTWFYVGGYLIFAIVAWCSTNGIAWSMHIKVAPRSGDVLHYKLLKSIIGAPLSFYSKTEIGALLNRFSQDIQLVDKQLATAFQSLCVQVFKLLMQSALLFSVQRSMLITLPFCALVVYLVQKVYLRTSRQLRFLELESRSAVYSSFLETIEGVTTIRAFGWEKKFETKNIAELEKSQSPLYLLLCLQRWLNIVLDLLVAGIAVGVIAVAVAYKATMTGGQIGVALNMVLLVNTTLLKLVESYTNVEISLGAVERLRETIEETPQEDRPGQGERIFQGWPSAGAVHVEKLQVSYNAGKLALDNITIEVQAGQKMILCGRTGSGKSTFILALLRLLDPLSGTISVDGMDVSHTSRSAVRQKCFIAVPQDPFILADATLRFNVDPMEHYTDAEIVSILAKTRLLQHFFRQTASSPETTSSSETSRILESTLSSLPKLSTGQQQLLSLTRAVLRAQPPSINPSPYRDHDAVRIKPILLLDEATSSLDEHTESMIYEIIQEEFTDKGYTVIAISHRLGALERGWKKGRDFCVRMVDGGIASVGELLDLTGGGGAENKSETLVDFENGEDFGDDSESIRA